MQLQDLIQRSPHPAPWSEGDNIPWHDPAFSQRMLKEHLSQAHDAASRRTEKIEKHVAWIDRTLLAEGPARVLDLGCGPGLYASRLAKLGHQCVGIDYGPASIAYAQAQAEREGLACRYICQDLRQADYGDGYDLAMLIFGEFNVFSPAHAKRILSQAWRALKSGGRLLLEPHTLAAIQAIGAGAAAWYATPAGLFSDRAHVCLQENSWDAASRAATTRYYILDAATAEVTRYAASYQAYTETEYRATLSACGFEPAVFYSSLAELETGGDLIAITAQKSGER
jgi:SAM-dependent methyltransferase